MAYGDRRRAHTRVTIAAAALLGLAAGSIADVAAAATFAPSSAVTLSEISCESDWVEIQNTDPKRSADVSGWLVSQKLPVVAGKAYRFPKHSLIKPGQRRIVKAASLPFKIGCGDNPIYLLAKPTSVIDRVRTPNLAAGFTWGFVGSTWQVTTPTPLHVNRPVADASADRAAWIYNPLKAYRIVLTADPANLQKLVADSKTYVPAKFQMEDGAGNLLPASGPLDIGLRVKGTVGTRTDPIFGPNGLNIVDDKVSLKLKFDFSVPGQTFFGLEKLTLNSMLQDTTMTHETLAYKLFRDEGLIAVRTGFANVYLNGSLRGLFLSLEAYDDIAIEWSVPDLGHIYEGQWGVHQGVWYSPDSPAPVIETNYEVDEGDKKNLDDVRALVAAVKDGTVFTSGGVGHLIADRVGAFFAVEKIANHWDGYSGSVPWAPNNFYLASDSRGQFQFMPGGVDATWRSVPGRAGLDANGNEPLGTSATVIFGLCLKDDRCASAYRRTLASAFARLPDLQKLAATLMATHQASRAADPLRLYVTADFDVRHATETDTNAEWKLVQAYFAQRTIDVPAYLKTVVTGQLRWTPASLKIAKGTRLSAKYLNAYSDVPGSFKYSVAAGTLLASGKRTISVTFTPTDASFTVQTKAIGFTVG